MRTRIIFLIRKMLIRARSSSLPICGKHLLNKFSPLALVGARPAYRRQAGQACIADSPHHSAMNGECKLLNFSVNKPLRLCHDATCIQRVAFSRETLERKISMNAFNSFRHVLGNFSTRRESIRVYAFLGRLLQQWSVILREES